MRSLVRLLLLHRPGSFSNARRRDDNRLSGGIPSPSSDQWPALRDVNMAVNQLSGQIPTELGYLTRLEHFVAFDNALSGTLPDELGALRELLTFNVGINNLNGTIPESYGFWDGIEILDVSHNSLSGVTSPLSEWPEGHRLLFSSNLFSGPLHQELETTNWENLEIVEVGENLYTGTIPADIGSATNLHILSVHSNVGLRGEIPAELGLLSALEALDIHNTQLVGDIPWELCERVSSGNLTIIITCSEFISCPCECICHDP